LRERKRDRERIAKRDLGKQMREYQIYVLLIYKGERDRETERKDVKKRKRKIGKFLKNK
jgi:hypothetical protein